MKTPDQIAKEVIATFDKELTEARIAVATMGRKAGAAAITGRCYLRLYTDIVNIVEAERQNKPASVAMPTAKTIERKHKRSPNNIVPSKERIQAAWEETRYNVTKCSIKLGTHRATMRKWLDMYELKRPWEEDEIRSDEIRSNVLDEPSEETPETPEVTSPPEEQTP